MSRRKLLIDGDIVAYKAAAEHAVWEANGFYFNLKREATQYGTPDYRGSYSADKVLVFGKAQRIIEDIVMENTRGFDVPLYEVFLSGSNNFRKDICEQYKAHRPEKKPKYLDDVRGFLEIKYKAQVSEGEEADDLIGKEHYKNFIAASVYKTIVCSTDKDFATIPGFLYNPFTKDLKFIKEDEANRFFYKQILMGDKADNIPGVKGIGPVKAERILKKYTKEYDMFRAVRITVRKQLKVNKSIAEEMILKTGQLLRIRRWEDEIWQLPSKSD